MGKYHIIENLHFIDNSMVLIIDGEEKEFQLSKLSQRLMAASESERNQFEISPSTFYLFLQFLLSIDKL